MFPPKNKNENPTPHRTQDLLKNTFLSSEKSPCGRWPLCHWRGPFGAGGRAETPAAGGGHVQGLAERASGTSRQSCGAVEVSQQPGSGEVKMTRRTFRVKPPRIYGQPKRLSVLWYHVDPFWESANSLSEMGFQDVPVRRVRAFLQGSAGGSSCRRPHLCRRAGAPDRKHMALETTRGWHQLLKVTLY